MLTVAEENNQKARVSAEGVTSRENRRFESVLEGSAGGQARLCPQHTHRAPLCSDQLHRLLSWLPPRVWAQARQDLGKAGRLSQSWCCLRLSLGCRVPFVGKQQMPALRCGTQVCSFEI